MLQNVRLLMPPIPTIEERGLFAVSAVVAIALFFFFLETSRSAFLRALKSLCP